MTQTSRPIPIGTGVSILPTVGLYIAQLVVLRETLEESPDQTEHGKDMS